MDPAPRPPRFLITEIGGRTSVGDIDRDGADEFVGGYGLPARLTTFRDSESGVELRGYRVQAFTSIPSRHCG